MPRTAAPAIAATICVAANASAADLRAAVDAMSRRADVTTQGMIAVGVSAGGFASIALSADPPPGLAAVINFAGGRGSRADNDVCDEDALVRAFATIGKTSRIPMLWVYASNDKFFGPELVRRMHAAFTAAGGRAQFVDAPAIRRDGQRCFPHGSLGLDADGRWIPARENLGTRD